MDRSRQLDLLPHYAAVVVLVGVVLGGIRVALGEVSAPLALGCVAAVVLAYPTVVRAVGLAPDAWENQ